MRDARWSEAIAVGTLAFIEKLKVSLESEQCIGRSRREMGSVYCANREAYRGEFATESDALRPENTFPWKRIVEVAET